MHKHSYDKLNSTGEAGQGIASVLYVVCVRVCVCVRTGVSGRGLREMAGVTKMPRVNCINF